MVRRELPTLHEGEVIDLEINFPAQAIEPLSELGARGLGVLDSAEHPIRQLAQGRKLLDRIACSWLGLRLLLCSLSFSPASISAGVLPLLLR